MEISRYKYKEADYEVEAIEFKVKIPKSVRHFIERNGYTIGDLIVPIIGPGADVSYIQPGDFILRDSTGFLRTRAIKSFKSKFKKVN